MAKRGEFKCDGCGAVEYEDAEFTEPSDDWVTVSCWQDNCGVEPGPFLLCGDCVPKFKAMMDRGDALSETKGAEPVNIEDGGKYGG